MNRRGERHEDRVIPLSIVTFIRDDATRLRSLLGALGPQAEEHGIEVVVAEGRDADGGADLEAEFPFIRRIVTDAESWFVEQVGPSRLDRIRRRRRARNDRPPFTDRVFAAWILGDELRGLLERADEKRSIYFILWEPPKPIADPEVALARFRHNIEKLLAEREWTGGYRRLHHRLKGTVEQLAVQDPATAMALVRRLPQYGERLLAPIREEER